MTFNDLFNGCTGARAKFNLLKDYPLGSNPGYVMVEVRNGEYYNVFMWDRSFSYCWFGAKYKPDYILEQIETVKAKNPELYAFAEAIRGVFGH